MIQSFISGEVGNCILLGGANVTRNPGTGIEEINEEREERTKEWWSHRMRRFVERVSSVQEFSIFSSRSSANF